MAELHAINVEKGDCFVLTVKKGDKDFVILYDSGTGESWESVYTGLVKNLPENRERVHEDGIGHYVTVDAVVLSHPDNDHYGGFKELLQKEKIKADDLYLFVPQFRRDGRKFLRARNFYNDLTTKYEYTRIDDGYLRFHGEAGIGSNLEKVNGHYKVKLVKDQVFLIYPLDNPESDDKNAKSILLHVMNPKILLSGDSNGSVILKHVDFPDNGTFHTFHVPHHGSRRNSSLPISDIDVRKIHMQFRIFSRNDILLQWSKEVAAKILMLDMDLYELLSTKPRRKIHTPREEICTSRGKIQTVLKNTMKIAAFYLHFPSQEYFISCGASDVRYNHPHMEVTCGIVLAAVVKLQKCTIVLNFARDLRELVKNLKLLGFVLPIFYPVGPAPIFCVTLKLNLPSEAKVFVHLPPRRKCWTELVTIKTSI